MGDGHSLHCVLLPPRGTLRFHLAFWGGGFHAWGADSRHVAGDQLKCGSLSTSGEQDLGF